MADAGKDTGQLPPPDGDIHPLLLLGFLDCSQPPGEFEVLSRLQAAGFSLDESDACPGPEDDALWHACYAIEEREPAIRVFAGTTRGYRPWRSTIVTWTDEDELARAVASRWVVGVESLQAEPPSDFFHLLLRILVAACGEDLTAVADSYAGRVRGGAAARLISSCPVPPAPDELFAVHWIGGEGAKEYWSHTHGLRAYGAPNLEVLGATRDGGYGSQFIITAIAEMLMGMEFDVSGGSLSFGHGLTAQLRPINAALKKFPATLLGGTDDRKDGDHGGWRLLVLDDDARWLPKKGADFSSLVPHRLIQAVADDAVVYHSNAESDRQAKLAKLRFPDAAMAFLSSSDAKKVLTVKLAIPADEEHSDYGTSLLTVAAPEGSNREHMWFEVSDFSGGIITGKLTNTPNYARYLTNGDVYRIAAGRLSGFQLFMNGRTYTPETIACTEKPGYMTDWRNFREKA